MRIMWAFSATLALAWSAREAAAAPVQFGGNGHYYELVKTNVDWTEAVTGAAGMTHLGVTGHLVTITSAAENAFVLGLLQGGESWIGASDAFVAEGVWRWEVGPEAGTVFWTGGIGGVPTGYANWAPGEPNDSNNEDFAHMYGNPALGVPVGTWNDAKKMAFGGLSYVVEYSGAPIPEPSTALLLAAALAIGWRMRKRF